MSKEIIIIGGGQAAANATKIINDNDVVQALERIGLSDKVSLSSAAWERHDSIVSIPWNVKSDI